MDMTELADKAVKQLSEKAGIDKSGQLSNFLYLRALGKDKTEIADNIGVNRKTLKRWEDKLDENLEPGMKSELIMNGMASEHQKRFYE